MSGGSEEDEREGVDAVHEDSNTPHPLPPFAISLADTSPSDLEPNRAWRPISTTSLTHPRPTRAESISDRRRLTVFPLQPFPLSVDFCAPL